MKHIIFFVIILLLAVNVKGQTPTPTPNVDSLINVLNTQKLTLDEEFTICKQLADFYQNSDADKLMKYARRVLEIAKENKKYNSSIAISYYYIGIAHHTKANLDSASVYYQKALDIALKTDDKQMEISAYVSFSAVFVDQGDYTKGLEYLMKALYIAEKTDNIKKQVTILSNIGTIYRRFDNDDHALQYFERAKVLAEKANLPVGLCAAYFNIGNIYLYKGDMDKALEYELKALDISRSIRHKSYEIGSLLTVAQIYNLKEFSEYEKAEKYATEGLQVAKGYEDPQMILQAYGVLADIYYRHKHYAECDVAASKAWEMDTTNIVAGKDYIGFIVHSNIFLGNKEKASQYLNLYADLVKKVNDESLHESLTEMEVKYETEKKEMRIASLEKERQLYVWLGIAGTLLVITLAIVLWQTIRNTRKEKLLIATRSVLDGEMKERTRLAQDLHDRLSGNLSAVKIELGNHAESLQTVRDKLDNCIKDIRNTAHDLMPTSLQSGLKIALEDFAAQFPNVRFHFFGEEKRIEERIKFVMYCCASELVNNSVKHSGAKSIDVQLVQGDDYIALTVEDDGCGFDEKTATKGMGLRNICDRVVSCGGKMDVATSSGKGTETTVEIKIK